MTKENPSSITYAYTDVEAVTAAVTADIAADTTADIAVDIAVDTAVVTAAAIAAVSIADMIMTRIVKEDGKRTKNAEDGWRKNARKNTEGSKKLLKPNVGGKKRKD